LTQIAKYGTIRIEKPLAAAITEKEEKLKIVRPVTVTAAMLTSNVPETDYPAWNSATTYVKGNRILDVANHLIYEALVGGSAVVGITTASPTTATWTNHGLPAGAIVQFSNSGGTLPTGIVAATDYYVQNPTSGTFQLSLTNGGALINVTAAGSGTNTCTATNTNRPITDTTAWINVGSDNRWRMFDQSVSSQTSQAGSIVVTITPGTRVDSIVGMNLSSVTSVQINVVDPTYGNVYSRTILMVADSGIRDWYGYFYEPVIQLSDFIVTDIPVAFSSASITVTINGSTPAIGCLVVGLSKEIGTTTEGAKIGIVDYGIKTKDAFGNYTILQRGYSKRADFTIKVATSEVDTLQNLFASYRSIPVVYVGSNVTSQMQFQSCVIYGYYKDFSLDISYPPYSTCSIQVEGLT
jgi:hypothetical protein